MFQRVTIVFVAAAMIFMAGCGTPAPALHAKEKTSVPVQTGAHPEARVHLFDEVTIHLPPIEAPGNHWTLVLNDERYLDPQGPVAPDVDGGGAMKFLAIRAGRRAVRFFALPPGKEAVPTQRYEIRLIIDEAK